MWEGGKNVSRGGVNKSIHKKDGIEDFPSCSAARAPCFDGKGAWV